MKLRRISAIIAVSLSTVLLTAGCVKLEMDMTVAPDDTVSGNMVFAISKSLAEMATEEAEPGTTPETDSLFTDVENVTVEAFDDGDFVGSSYTFEKLPIAQFAPQVVDGSAFAIERQGDNLVISGTFDTSSESQDLEANPFADSIAAGFAASSSIRIAVTLPGEIIETNGQVDGQTITWKGNFGEKLVLEAVAVSPLGTPINWLVVGGIGGILLGVGGVLFVWLMGRKKLDAPEAKQQEEKAVKPKKKKTKAEILAEEALAQRPWYQKKRFAFPAMGLFLLSFAAIAIGLMQSQAGTSSIESSNPTSNSIGTSDGSAEGDSSSDQSASSAPAAPPSNVTPKAAAAAPSGRQAPSQVVSATETESQLLAREDAYYYWSEDWYSRTGLINWLVDIGHSYDDSVYATDSLGVDWTTEALGMANNLVSEYFYSRLSLIYELEVQGFSPSEATAGVDGMGHDWYDEAYSLALELITYEGYSEQEAYDQLVAEQFTADEASYGSSWAAQQ